MVFGSYNSIGVFPSKPNLSVLLYKLKEKARKYPEGAFAGLLYVMGLGASVPTTSSPASVRVALL